MMIIKKKSGDSSLRISDRVFPGKDMRISLSIYLDPIPTGPIAVKMSKVQRSKVMTSSEDNPYLAKGITKERPLVSAIQRINLSETTYNWYISEKGIPDSLVQLGAKGSKLWQSKPWWWRLELHLSEIAEGRRFTYELL